MKRTVSNEKLRLDADFFSNLGVGAYIAGAVAPAVPLYQDFPFVDFLFRKGELPPFPANAGTAIFLALWCIGAALVFRHMAHKIIDRMD